MAYSPEVKVYGLTGEIGRDGLLTQDQQEMLDAIQERAVNASLDHLFRRLPGDNFPLVAMATGIGKGRIVHLTTEREVKGEPDEKVIIVAGTKNVLVKQTHESLTGYQTHLPDDTYVESQDLDEENEETSQTDTEDLFNGLSFLYKTGPLGDLSANVHVMTIQGLLSAIKRERINPPDYRLAFVDEVHNIGTRKRLAAIKQFSRVIGLTATPYRHSGVMKNPNEYGFDIVESLPLPEAQRLRLLPPLVGIQIDTKDIVDEIPVNSKGQIDFTKLEKILKASPDLRPYIADKVAILISGEGKKYKTVIACNFVWEAQELAELLQEKGIKVGVAVNEKSAKEIDNERIPALHAIERYKLPENDERSIQVLISPYVASEGFDAPFTEVLVWASPTDSPLRYTQYVGRLARRTEGKLFGVVIDCLYQTNKYRWSYNMGMWMKGDIQQLDSGLLYLGPEQDIERLKKLPQVQTLIALSDRTSLDGLQKDNILNVQETDFVLSFANLRPVFIGEARKLRPILREVVEKLKAENANLVPHRLNVTKPVLVTTDRERFIKEMQARGIELRIEEFEEVKETDFSPSAKSLNATFIGGDVKLRPMTNQVIDELKKENPKLFVRRKSGNNIIEVCTNRDLFIDRMLAKGAILQNKDLLSIQPGDFSTIGDNLTGLFTGKEKWLISIAIQVLEDMEKEGAEVLERKSGKSHIVTVVRDQELFEAKMQEKGAQLKPK